MATWQETKELLNQSERVNASISGNGGRLLTGGTHDGTVFSPTVIADVAPDAPVIADETFGPVIAIRSFTDAHEAIAEVNAGAYGLQAGVFTRDVGLVLRAWRALEVGGVVHDDLHADLRDEVHRVLGAAIDLGVPLLAAVALNFTDGHAENACLLKTGLDILERERLDDRCNQLHVVDPFR